MSTTITATTTKDKAVSFPTEINVNNETASLTSSALSIGEHRNYGVHHKRDDHGGSSVDAKDYEKKNSLRRRIAVEGSLYVNIFILLTKIFAYATTGSLSVLAALIDSFLDVASQFVMDVAAKFSSKVSRSTAHYPAGASRMEPIGVLTCAALMGMASFEVIKESVGEIFLFLSEGKSDRNMIGLGYSSFWSLCFIILIKLILYELCQRAAAGPELKTTTILKDSTLEALAQDHMNDILSNAVAALALIAALSSSRLWFLDPLGAVGISLYIIYSWYVTGKEQIEQLTGKVAPQDLITELTEIARHFDERMEVDVCRAYHFGPKFLVELEVVLPRDTLLWESHDLGMELQYEIEGREEVERCFVHIDYETRDYDEHVVSKEPELRERLVGKLRKSSSICNSV